MSSAKCACLAVIPARGGSTRIPRKNIPKFLGRPLIAYTIAAAQESGLFERVIVSTDDPEVADVSCQFGAEVPFIRPASLADNRTASSPVTTDALERVRPERCAVFLCGELLPTCLRAMLPMSKRASSNWSRRMRLRKIP